MYWETSHVWSPKSHKKIPKNHNGFYLLCTFLLKQSIISAYEIRENRSYNHNNHFLMIIKKKKTCFQLNELFPPGVSITLHSHPPTCLPSVTQWPHPIHRKNPCPLCAGNAAVVKPSELSEFSSLLLRALLPRYLDQVWTPAAIVAERWGMKAFCQEWTIENRAAWSTVMMLIRSVLYL